MTTCANLVRAMAVFLQPNPPAMYASVSRQLGVPLAWHDYRFSLRGTPLVSTEMLATPLTDDDLAPLFTKPVEAETAAGLIDIDTFRHVDMRVGRVEAAERLAKSKKLLKLRVAIGAETRQVIAGIAEHYAPESLIGRLVIVVANLKPAVLMGQKSEGMLLAAKDPSGALVLLTPRAGGARGLRFMSPIAPARERISVRPVDEGAASRLAAELGIPAIGARILACRNLTDADACRRFFDPSLDGFHDPFLFCDMEKATARIGAAIAGGEKIAVYGDYDVDGITGTAMLVRVLRALGGAVDYFMPHRLTEGYGVSASGVRQVAESGARL